MWDLHQYSRHAWHRKNAEIWMTVSRQRDTSSHLIHRISVYSNGAFESLWLEFYGSVTWFIVCIVAGIENYYCHFICIGKHLCSCHGSMLIDDKVISGIRTKYVISCVISNWWIQQMKLIGNWCLHSSLEEQWYQSIWRMAEHRASRPPVFNVYCYACQ